MYGFASGFCFTDANGMPFSHDWRLVALSYIVASVGSYAALAMAERLRQLNRQNLGLWQAGSAFTLGGSIWSMHLVAMLALHIGLPLSYDPLGTLVSLLIAVGSVAGGLAIARRGVLSWQRLLAAGAVIGSGVAIMHYVGMAALLFPGSLGYRVSFWGASIAMAIAAAVAALWLTLKLEPDWRLRVVAALVMGLAICGMHYIGMAGTVFISDPLVHGEPGVQAGPMAVAVAGVTLALLAAALVIAAADSRLAMEAERAAASEERSAAERMAAEQERAVLGRDLRLTRQSAEQEKSIQALLATVFKVVDTPLAIMRTDGQTVLCNPSFDRLVGQKPGALAGRPIGQAVLGSFGAESLAAATAVVGTEGHAASSSLEATILRTDGTSFAASVSIWAAPQAELRQFRILTFASAATGATFGRGTVPGKLRFIRLDEVRALLGDEWKVLKSRVLAQAQVIIRAHLRPEDRLTETTDLGFLLAFGDASEADATERCAAIVTEIMDSLVRQGEDAATVEMSSAIGKRAIEEDQASRSLELEQGRSTARRTADVPGCRFEMVQGCDRGLFVGWYVSGVEGDANRNRFAQSETMDRVLDAVVAQAAVTSATQMTELLFVTVSFAQFDSRVSAEHVVARLRSLEEAVRQRVVVMLADLPGDVHVTRVQDAVRRLQVVCHSVGFCLSELDAPAFDLSVFRSPLLAVDAARWGEALPVARIGKLALALHLRRARLLVRHAEGGALAKQLKADGVDFLTMDRAPEVLLRTG